MFHTFVRPFLTEAYCQTDGNKQLSYKIKPNEEYSILSFFFDYAHSLFV